MVGKKTLVVCVGNKRRGDDGLGPYVAESLKGRLRNIRVMDCGTTVENHIPDIANLRPEVLLMVNALDEGRKPGTIIQREFKNQASNQIALAHTIPLENIVLLIRSLMLEEEIRAYLLGVQAGSFEKLGDKVREAAGTIARNLRELQRSSRMIRPNKMVYKDEEVHRTSRSKTAMDFFTGKAYKRLST